MTDWTPEEDEAFNEVEKQSNLGKQILRDIEGQPYHYAPKYVAFMDVPHRPWVGLTDEEIESYWDYEDFQTGCGKGTVIQMVRDIEAKLRSKNGY